MGALVGEKIQNREAGRNRDCADEPIAPCEVEAHGFGHREDRDDDTERHQEEREESHDGDVARVVGRVLGVPRAHSANMIGQKRRPELRTAQLIAGRVVGEPGASTAAPWLPSRMVGCVTGDGEDGTAHPVLGQCWVRTDRTAPGSPW